MTSCWPSRKRRPCKNVQRGKLEGVGLPAIDQGVDLRRDRHHIDDHRRGDGDLRDALEHRRDALVDRSVEEGFLHDGEVGAGILIHFQPRVLEGTGEAHQRDEGADAHADAAQGERGPQTAAPDISPGESYKRQSHRVGCSNELNLQRRHQPTVVHQDCPPGNEVRLLANRDIPLVRNPL
jgi:hypothetical protein